MRFTYRISVDEAYARTFLKRFRQSRSPYLHVGAIALSFLVLIGSLIFIAIEDPAPLPIVLRSMADALWPVGVGVGIAFAVVPLLRARQIRRMVSAARGGGSVMLSEEGVSTTDEHSQSHAEWSAYDHVLRYHDGLMLMRMKKFPTLWLPDTSLVDASPEEVRSLVAKMLPLKSVV